MQALSYTVLVIVALAIATIFSGYTLSILWEWFVVPTFNLPKLNIPSAIGLALIINYLTTSHEPSDKNSGRSAMEIWGEAIAAAFARPLFALIFGSIYVQFM